MILKSPPVKIIFVIENHISLSGPTQVSSSSVSSPARLAQQQNLFSGGTHTPISYPARWHEALQFGYFAHAPGHHINLLLIPSHNTIYSIILLE